MIEDIKTQHHFSSGVYARQMELPKGWKAESHKHKFDHMSILAKGKVTVTVNGKKTEYKAPTVVTIEAHKIHEIYAHEDSLWFCVHANSTNEINPNSVEKILIEEA